MKSAFESRSRAGYASLAIAALVVGAKLAAYAVTGSVALLSDAAESLVNVIASVAVIFSLRLAQRPPDYEHPYGHTKIEYLTSALEGAMIFLAAGIIFFTAGSRLLAPQPVEALGLGIAITVLASLLNVAGALYLFRVARRTNSAALDANARHMLTDVWTSAGVVASLILIGLTGWTRLDPIIAMLVAVLILREGWGVIMRSSSGLLDARLPEQEEQVILDALDSHAEVLGYHRLRSRRAGHQRFAEVDIFVDPDTTVKEAHDMVARLEDDLIQKLPDLTSTIHVEPYEAGQRDSATSPSQEFGKEVRRQG